VNFNTQREKRKGTDILKSILRELRKRLVGVNGLEWGMGPMRGPRGELGEESRKSGKDRLYVGLYLNLIFDFG